MITEPIKQLGEKYNVLQSAFASSERIFQILDEEISPVPPALPEPARRGPAELSCEALEFAYKAGQPVLRGVSFTVPAGTTAAIVGPTGAGKSTLVGLIPRFYDPQEGRILIDGRELADVTVKSLRDQISIVLQEPLLFSGTIGENIRYGRLEATDEELAEAARAANAHDFIRKLPKGYETRIGERGAQLSGGERQRIAVARAFLKDAPILILDEPTSSIDSRTEAVILDALDRLIRNRTTFLVAHRLSTIRSADAILVLDQGSIVEAGTHDQLVARDGLYRQLHDAQSGDGRIREATGVGVPGENGG
jgi:ABC-type multidrug transport system fused ATPase/permease subunit